MKFNVPVDNIYYSNLAVFRHSIALVVVGFFLVRTSAVVLAVPENRTTTQRRCDPIGRVLDQGDNRLTAGSLLCQGERLTLASGVKVDFLCFLNRRILSLLGGTVSDTDECVPKKVRVKPCSYGDTSNCPKPKGPGSNSNTPAIVSPYSSTLLNGRPLLSWYSVASATSYTVEVRGEGVGWQKTVLGTSLAYPNEQPAMQFGNAYKITIVANQGDDPVSASVSVVNLLPQSEATLVLNTVERINSLNLPKDEAAFLDLDTIYMSKNLLTETISSLESRVRVGSLNPAIYRVLGDRYLEAGLPDYAKHQYEIASEFARKSANSIELAKAEAGLERVERYNQLPTRIKGAQ